MSGSRGLSLTRKGGQVGVAAGASATRRSGKSCWAQAEGKFRAHHYAGERQESAEEKAGRILGQELQSLGLRPGELEKRLKADPDRVRIAQRLRMGQWTYLSNNLSKTTRKPTLR